MSFTSQPYAKIREKLLAGELSVSTIVAQHLAQIQAYNHSLNAFLEVYEEEAILKAVQVDEKIKAGTAGKLAGLVVGIKDLLCYEGHHSYAGSKILDTFKSTFSATAVQRLLDEDAIIIGRQNCDEFGMGSTNENSAYGPVLNFTNQDYVAGGSSGGSGWFKTYLWISFSLGFNCLRVLFRYHWAYYKLCIRCAFSAGCDKRGRWSG